MKKGQISMEALSTVSLIMIIFAYVMYAGLQMQKQSTDIIQNAFLDCVDIAAQLDSIAINQIQQTKITLPQKTKFSGRIVEVKGNICITSHANCNGTYEMGTYDITQKNGYVQIA